MRGQMFSPVVASLSDRLGVRLPRTLFCLVDNVDVASLL